MMMGDLGSPGATKFANPSKRINEIDVIRATAVVLVVLLHSSSPVMYQIATTSLTVWQVHNFVDSAARICVPLFFMVSGYLLLGSTEGNQSSVLSDVPKRLVKVLLPLLAWSIIYRMNMVYVNGGWPAARSILTTIRDMLEGAVVYHLWFLYELAALYLLLPILRRLFQPTDLAAKYFLCLWFVLLSARLFSGLTGGPFPIGNYFNLGSSGYLVAGYLIRRSGVGPDGRVAVSALITYLVTTMITVYLTESYSATAGAYVETFHVYTTPNVVIMSVSAFIVLLYAGRKISQLLTFNSAVSTIGAHSFGIYLVHVLILERISYNVLGTPASTAWGALVRIVSTAGFVLATSFVIAWCIRRFRITRWMAP
jgi:surface polysaccharide O-acyltransferase-like enzyme